MLKYYRGPTSVVTPAHDLRANGLSPEDVKEQQAVFDSSREEETAAFKKYNEIFSKLTDETKEIYLKVRN